MILSFEYDSETCYKVALELCGCLHQKSKWNLGSWTWVSMSNLRIYYDSQVARVSNSFLPKRLNLDQFLVSLAELGLVEKNSDMFLKDQFFRLTKLGRDSVEAKNLKRFFGLSA